MDWFFTLMGGIGVRKAPGNLLSYYSALLERTHFDMRDDYIKKKNRIELT